MAELKATGGGNIFKKASGARTGSSSNSALARANEAIRPSRLFWNQQLVCRRPAAGPR